MTVSFTVEEMITLKEANQPTRISAITFFEQGLSFYSQEERELANYTKSLIEKLKAMTDIQYIGIDFNDTLDFSEPTEED